MSLFFFLFVFEELLGEPKRVNDNETPWAADNRERIRNNWTMPIGWSKLEFGPITNRWQSDSQRNNVLWQIHCWLATSAVCALTLDFDSDAVAIIQARTASAWLAQRAKNPLSSSFPPKNGKPNKKPQLLREKSHEALPR